MYSYQKVLTGQHVLCISHAVTILCHVDVVPGSIPRPYVVEVCIILAREELPFIMVMK